MRLSDAEREHSEIFKPLVKAAELDFPLYIREITLIEIQAGPRYMFHCTDLEDKTHFRLMLGVIEQRTSIYQLFEAIPGTIVGPCRLERIGRAWIIVDAE